MEFCHAWIKSKLGQGQFHVRGLRKVKVEMLRADLREFRGTQAKLFLGESSNAPAESPAFFRKLPRLSAKSVTN